MKKTDELKKEIDAKRQEVEKLQREEQLDAAFTASQELDKMMNEYKIAKSLEDSDFEKFSSQAKSQATQETTDKAVLRNRAFNKLVLQNGSLTEAEREAYFNVAGSPGQPGQIESIPSKGGYLLPEDQYMKLQTFAEDLVSLRDYVTVIETKYTTGKWPTLPPQNLNFVPFEEMTDITEGDVTFGQDTYTILDKGIIIPISRQLYDDVDMNIIDVLGDQLAIAKVKSENEAILSPIIERFGATGTTTPYTAITTYKDLNRAIIKDLNGIFQSRANIYTNQSGMLWLSNLEDGNNRPLLQPDVTQAGVFRFHGKPVVMIPDEIMENITSGADEFAPIYVGDLKSFETFFERKGLELALSTELFFKKYGLALRGVIRHGVKLMDTRAIIGLKVKVN